MNDNNTNAYWKANVALIRNLLIVWAVVSFGLGIVFVEPLNAIKLPGGVPFGFWMAQQGSIYIFVVLIFIYANQMDKLDRKFRRRAEVQDNPSNAADQSLQEPPR